MSCSIPAPLGNSPGCALTRPMELEVRLSELSAFFSVFSFHMPLADMARAASVDAALVAGAKDFCLIQRPGHIFYGYDPLSYAMKQAMDACDFVTGGAGSLLINRTAFGEIAAGQRSRPRLANEMRPLGQRRGSRASWTCDIDDSDIFALAGGHG